MEIEQLEIRDYLSQCAPLNKLSGPDLDQLVMSVEIIYRRKGDELLTPGENNHTLYLIRSGSLAVYDDEKLYGQFSSGDWAGYRSALGSGEIVKAVRVSEDSLLYCLPANLMRSLGERYEAVSSYFHSEKSLRLRSATTAMREGGETTLIQKKVQDLVHGQPLKVQVGDSILSVAQAMKDAGYTMALVMQGNTLAGIVTDRAYCTKVVAGQLEPSAPISSIMSTRLITLDKNQTGSDALLVMSQHNIRHLPVMDGEKVTGVVTATDLIREQSHHSVYLVNEINRADNVAELTALCKQIPSVLQNLIASSMTAYDIGQLISAIGEAVVRRLVQLVQKTIGEAPIPFAFIIAGSMARRDQTAVSDQDNALFLADEYNEEDHGAYFEQLARFVCDGLNDCGYVYCPGDVMAVNPKWRQPVKVWRQYFEQWINEPEPKALMHASIFFDLRCAAGEASLLEKVQKEILEKTKNNTIFLKFLIGNALNYRPPIGLFRHFVLEDNSQEEKALNMKKRGVTPITDLARVYALMAGISDINTQQRLEAASEAGILSKDGMSDLCDALEFIATVRMQHQALQSAQAKPVDNYVKPDILSSLERRHLKDAFDVVRDMQTVLEQRY